MEKRIAILHTTPATITSLRELCARLLPGVTVNHFLDDSLLPEINRDGCISNSVRERFARLVALAAASGPQVIMSACSTVGGLLEALRSDSAIPLARIDEPMACQAAESRGRLIVCATLPSTLGPTLDLIRRKAGPERPIDSLLVEGAGALLSAGDQEGYLSLIASRLHEAAATHECVVLAQASMAQAAQRLPPEERARLLTSPESGVAALKKFVK